MEDIASGRCCLCHFVAQSGDDLDRHIFVRHPEIFASTFDAAKDARSQTNEIGFGSSGEVLVSSEGENSNNIPTPLTHDPMSIVQVKLEQSDEQEESEQDDDTPASSPKRKTGEALRTNVKTKAAKGSKRGGKGQALPKPEQAKKHQCEFCDRAFTWKNVMERHVREVHEGNRRVRKSTNLKCDVCHKIFDRKDSLRTHQRVHESYLKLHNPCFECSSIFSSKEILKTHLRDEHGCDWPADLLCEVCDAVFYSSSGFRRHQLEQHGTQRPDLDVHFEKSCIICRKVFNKAFLFFKHIREEHHEMKDERNQCQACSDTFADEAGLKFHCLEAHADVYCEKCDRIFNRRYHLMRHQTSCHDDSKQGTRKFPCKRCDKEFVSKDQLKYHLLEEHDNKWVDNLQCQICGGIFYSKHDLARHERNVHNKEKTQICYQCTMCEKKFWSKVSLRFHQSEAHPAMLESAAAKSEEHPAVAKVPRERNKTFSCCDVVFPSCAAWKVHLKDTHSTKGDWPDHLKCPDCGKGFYSKGVMKHHQRLVHSQKNELCRLCGVAFEDRESVYNHQRKVHASEIQEGVEGATNECKVCKVTCDDPEALQDHLDESHQDVKCRTCDKYFSSRRKLKIHAREVHSDPNKKIHTCQLCNTDITGLNSIKQHLKNAHEGQWFEDLQCVSCCKVFFDREKLQRHQQEFHSGKRQFLMCKHCGLFFTTHISRETHLVLAHGKDRPSCHLCGTSFFRPCDLNNHVRKVHSRKESPAKKKHSSAGDETEPFEVYVKAEPLSD